jgi:hypothetical protein
VHDRSAKVLVPVSVSDSDLPGPTPDDRVNVNVVPHRMNSHSLESLLLSREFVTL